MLPEPHFHLNMAPVFTAPSKPWGSLCWRHHQVARCVLLAKEVQGETDRKPPPQPALQGGQQRPWALAAQKALLFSLSSQ